jgi:hypothetical protein
MESIKNIKPVRNDIIIEKVKERYSIILLIEKIV